jgi:hypothetical protein
MTGVINSIAQSLVTSMAPMVNQATQQAGRTLHQHASRIAYHGVKHAVQVTSTAAPAFINPATMSGLQYALYVGARETTEKLTKTFLRALARRA